MGLFRHPHLIRGVVHTPKGSFVIRRGVVDAPDDVGESYGWQRLGLEDQREGSAPIATSPTNTGAIPLEF
jgi:hypothetical protein